MTKKKQPKTEQVKKKIEEKKGELAQKLQAVKKKSKKNKKSGLKPNFALPNLGSKALIVIGVVSLLAILWLSKDLVIAGMVNGKPISRLSILKQAEKAQGAQILEGMITDRLILAEAKEQNIQVSEEEINQQIDEIRSQISATGQDFEQALAMQNMTVEDLEERIKIQKVVEQLLADRVEVTEEEIDQYLEDNKDFLPEDLSEEELRAQAEAQLQNQQLAQEYRTWLEELKEKAQIRYFVQYAE